MQLETTVEDLEKNHPTGTDVMLHHEEDEYSIAIMMAWLQAEKRPYAFGVRHYYNMRPARYSVRPELHAYLDGPELRALRMACLAEDVTALADAQRKGLTASILSINPENGYYLVFAGKLAGRHSPVPLSDIHGDHMIANERYFKSRFDLENHKIIKP